MKQISVIILLCFAVVFVDGKADTSDDILSLSDRLHYESSKSTINAYRQMVSDVSRDTIFSQYLVDFASHCYYIGKYEEAIQVWLEASNIYKEVYGYENNKYATLLSKLAYTYSDIGNYDEGLRLGTEALEIRKKTIGTNHSDYAESLSILSDIYSSFGNYDEAIRLGTEALEIRRKTLGTNHPDYALSLGNLSFSYSALRNYDEAIRLGTEALEIRKKTHGTDCSDYAISLGNMAYIYSDLGNNDEAIRLGKEALEMIKKIHGTDNLYYLTFLGNLSGYSSQIGNYDEATRLGREALEIRKRVLGTDHPDYAMSLGNLANFYDELGNHEEAIRLGSEALEIAKRTFRTENPDYAKLLNNLACLNSGNGNYDVATQLMTEALEIRKRTLGPDHPDYAESLVGLASIYYEIGDQSEPTQLLNDYMQIVRNEVLVVFGGLTANERQMYWNKYRSNLIEAIPQIFLHLETPGSSSFLYDNIALFSKGLLLSTELEMAKLIQESRDDEAEQMYSEFRQNRQILNFQYSKPIAERYIKCDSLEKVSADLERKLVSRVKEFGDYTKNLSITWKDVQEKLDDSDIAIEFLSYPENDSTVAYIALTLCKKDTAPLLTPLFTELELKEVSGEDGTYQNAAADSLIWRPLASRLESKSHIYFSAAGMLHYIGIEYLPSMEGKDCFRLSSTRELVTHKPNGGIKSATLFGGIDYDATYASIKSSVPSSTLGDLSASDTIYYAENKATGPIIYKQGGRGGLDEYNSMRAMRYSVGSLPGSRKEIQDISVLLKESGFKVQDCDTITRNQASEESFKALSGQRRSLIHISTHGFYYDTIEAKNKGEHLRMMLMGDDRPSHSEDRSLLRCGLCFAGANQFLREMKNPADGQDEGVLNALEIAQTDLRGLDLVVLSACQTALGDVVNGEGVFGLQRGFKKAGAQSILMSLWIVDDDITRLLMTEFYRAWTSTPGMTKAGALKQAQDAVKKEYPNPHDWAAFIIIDALD